MAENWYIILELEFDTNPIYDEEIIKAKIDEKVKFWNKEREHYKYGPIYRKYLGMVSSVRNDMNVSDKRERLVEEARKILYDPIDKDLKMIMVNKKITENKLQGIADRNQKKVLKEDPTAKWFSSLITADLIKNRALFIGIEIVEATKTNYQELYDKYYKQEPKEKSIFDSMNSLLKTFNVKNLYEFLVKDSDTPAKGIEGSPCENLRELARTKKKNKFFRDNDSTHSNGKNLCSKCETDAFKDEGSKILYDNYIQYNRRKATLDEVKEFSKISGILSEDQMKIFIGQLTEVLNDNRLAKEVLIAYCEIENITYDKPPQPPQPPPDTIDCRKCGRINDKQNTKCEKCDEDLYIKCPTCETLYVANSNLEICKKCGFRLKNKNTVDSLCILAEAELNNMNFDVAEVRLDDAERFWPGSGKVASLRKELIALKQGPVGTAAKSMRAAVSEKRYYEARKQYNNIKKLFPDFKETDLENEIQTALDSADAELKKAKATKSEKDIIDFCGKAYEICQDYPGVKELIPVPLPPSNLQIVSDGNTRANILEWDKSTSVGMVYYTVTRKKDVAPININDGEVLGRVSACGFNDSKIEPAASYFYAIFAERAGIQSKPFVNTSPAINLFEVSNLTITAGDSLLQLGWDALPSGAAAEVYRKNETGKEEKITSSTSISYLDSGLKNDSLYSYVVKLAYIGGGKRQTTPGISISGSPTKPPNPIEELNVKPGDGDKYIATWGNPDNVNVELYCSTEKPSYKYGDLVSQQLFEKKMSRLALNRTSNTTATFKHSSDELLYITAVIIKSGSVVFGALARASRAETVKINSILPVNGKINIYLDAPKGVTGFVVLYRFDKFPNDISDIQTIRKYISHKQYLHDSALVIDSLEQKDYFFSVFAEFKRDDGEKDYSIGANYQFSNASKEVITYSIKVSGWKNKSATLTFEAVNKVFTLPEIDVMSEVGAAPISKASAKHFSIITSQPVNGNMQITIPFPKNLPRGTHIKAFLKDETLASKYKLKLNLNSKYQIS